jgi:hypothetical protein
MADKTTPLAEQQSAPETFVEPQYVPAPQAYVAPQKRIERQGRETVPYVRRYPQVRAGTCEFCGTIDPYTAGDKQYTLCEHYRGMSLQCSYCDVKRDPEDVVARHVLNVAEHPSDPSTLIVWCNSLPCVQAHEKRFKIST